MVKKRVIPCLDVAGGRVVKGVNFVDLRDMGEPVELATRYSELGADELVFLDITATLEGRGPMLEIVERSAEELSIPFTVGGGVTGLEDARALLRAGADKVAVNRAAFDDPSILTGLADEFGSQAVVCAIDARAGEVVTHAGTRPRGRPAIDWAAEAVERRRGRDPAHLDRRRRHARRVRPRRSRAPSSTPSTCRSIASGGAGEARHLAEAFDVGAEAALIASIVHERPERLPELKSELRELGWDVRTLTPAIVQDADDGPRAHARLHGRGGAAAHPRDAARRGSGAARARSTGTRARRRATRSPSRRSATTATATRSCCACGRPAPPATPAPSRASRRGCGASSRSGRPSGPRAPTSSRCSTTGPAGAARKVGEEGLEAALAGVGESDERLVEELADLWFHSYVLLAARGLDVTAVEDELRRRHAAS